MITSGGDGAGSETACCEWVVTTPNAAVVDLTYDRSFQNILYHNYRS